MGVFTTTKQYRLGLNLMPQWWLSGASIDLDFDQQRYYDSSLAAGVQSLAPLNSYLSCSRASTGYAKTASGTLTSFGNDTLRITTNGLLVEGARTNINPIQDLTDGSYTKDQITIDSTTITAPDQTNTAFQVTENSATNFHRVFHNAGVPSLSSGDNTYSCFFKKGATNGRRYVFFMATENLGPSRYGMVIDLDTGTITLQQATQGSPGSPVASLETFANGWYRASIKLNVGSATTGEGFFGGSDSATPTLGSSGVSYTGDGASNFYAWGQQAEAGSFASSYIPTSGASATRAQDAISIIGGLSTLATSLPASCYADVLMNAIPTGTWRIVGDSNAGGGNRALLNTASNNTQVQTTDSGTSAFATLGNSLTWTGGVKVAMAQSSGTGTAFRSVVGGGGSVGTSASISGEGMLTPVIGYSASAGVEMYGYLRRLAMWNSKLADATLQSLTAP